MKSILIGYGYWGKIIHKKLSLLTDCTVINSSKVNFDEYLKEKYDIAFVCTPTDSHYNIVKKCINHNIKTIFCEKPFTGNFDKATELLKLASSKNINIYIDNVFLYRTEIKNINVNNNIYNIKFIWNKFEKNINGKYKDNIVNTLLYHDIYLLIYITNTTKWFTKYIKVTDDNIYLNLYNDNHTSIFEYNRQDTNTIKQIYINEELVDLSKPKNDPLLEIITNLTNNVSHSVPIDYHNNNKLTLDTLSLIRNIIID